MKRSLVETVIGAVVLLGAMLFLAFSYKTGNVGSMEGYNISANFSGIGGLKVGDSVQISGVKVGQVAKVELDPKTFLAKVTMSIGENIKVPEDTAALISSESLLGGRYMSLEPGSDEAMLKDGGEIQFTQAPQNLEQLLGQFIFSMQGEKKDGEESAAEESGEAPAAVETPAETAPPESP